MERWLSQTCGATTCAQLPRLFLVFQQQGDGPKSSLELVWDGKFADKYFCLRSAAGVILKTCFTLDRAPVPLQWWTWWWPFYWLPSFPWPHFPTSISRNHLPNKTHVLHCHFSVCFGGLPLSSFLSKSYSFSCIFPVLQDPALPSQATPAHSLLSSDTTFSTYSLSCSSSNIIEHLMESEWIGWVYHSHWDSKFLVGRKYVFF